MKLACKALALAMVLIVMSKYSAAAQDSTSLYNKILHFPDKLFKKVDDKTADINAKLVKQTSKYLQRLSKQEARLKKQLAKKDSLAAKQIFGDTEQRYVDLQNSLKGLNSKASNLTSKASSVSKRYLPHLDTLKTAFKFLSNTDALDKAEGLLDPSKLGKADDLVKKLPNVQGKLQDAIGKMDDLQNQFNQIEDIKRILEQRKQLLQEQLGKFGMLKQLQAYKKQVYYYQAQVEEYKKTFDDPSKLEAKALELLSKTQVFKDFFAKHSQLASMFRLPQSSSGNSSISLEGLQTREAVQQEMMQRYGSMPDMQQAVHQQVQGAKDQLQRMKDKVNKLAEGVGGDPSMPDFKPNNQKTKSLLQRLEFGSNLQTVKSNKFFPSTTDIGLSLGYKLNDKSTIGIGGSYKMGWGKDIRHIAITHQGMGVRTFLDYKIKGSFWMSGGAELNYRSQFKDFEILENYSAWQKSALIGISKKYQLSSKVKGNAQLMYDALWKEQIPRTQPVVFRIGYHL